MTDPALDQAEIALRAHGHIAMTLAQLAEALGAALSDPAGLQRRLRDDDRFVILGEDVALPGLDQWPDDLRLAYAAAFHGIDMLDRQLVLLAAPAPQDCCDHLARLLHSTVIRLLGTHEAPATAAAAERVRHILAGITPSGAERPTTSFPPDPPPP